MPPQYWKQSRVWLGRDSWHTLSQHTLRGGKYKLQMLSYGCFISLWYTVSFIASMQINYTHTYKDIHRFFIPGKHQVSFGLEVKRMWLVHMVERCDVLGIVWLYCIKLRKLGIARTAYSWQPELKHKGR